MMKIYTTGVFDLLHPGHLAILRRARSLGDKLIVGLQKDNSVESQKGKKPIMNFKDRRSMLLATPFVDEVIGYSNLDQRKVLQKIKPNILVQGGDWLKTGDRSKILSYLKENNIKLVQFPYTKSISSTQLKEKIYRSLKEIRLEKSLDFNPENRLRILPIKSLLTYEYYDPIRTNKLVKNITKRKIFNSPIIVGSIGKDKYIVIDGANRLQAMKNLNMENIPAQIVNYLDQEEVSLIGNEHYFRDLSIDFSHLLAQNSIPLRKASRSVKKAHTICMIYWDDKTYTIDDQGGLMENILTLNRLVNSYKGKLNIRRKSEVGNLINDENVVIKFNSFSPSDIIQASLMNINIESGITWHRINNVIIHLDIPLNVLSHNTPERLNKYLKKLLHEKSKNGGIRRYTSNVFVCDEWD